jgi:hypothetical protein
MDAELLEISHINSLWEEDACFILALLLGDNIHMRRSRQGSSSFVVDVLLSFSKVQKSP